MSALDILRIISATGYGCGLIGYSVALLVRSDPKYHAHSEVLVDNIIVCGLNLWNYIYLLDDGFLGNTWLTYSLSCVFLSISYYRVLTYDVFGYGGSGYGANKVTIRNSDGTISLIERDPPYVYYGMIVSVFLTLISGYVIHILPSYNYRVAVFVLAFIPFGLTLFFLLRAVNLSTQGVTVARLWIRIVTWATFAFWSGYPIAMALGPLFAARILTKQVALGYVILDFVTKHTYMALSAIYMHIEVDRRLDKHDSVKIL